MTSVDAPTGPIVNLYGVDFSSTPRRRKPIVVAAGRLLAGPDGPQVRAQALLRLETLDAFEAWLRTPGPWLGGFDFPFGLPRELVDTLGWPARAHAGRSAWQVSIEHLQAFERRQLVEIFRAFCAARPAGSKFAHRATDRPAGSSPSMKWVNPPVAFMLHAGAPRLLRAGVTVPGLHAGDPARIALEAYPGLLARAVLGRASYKSDEAAKAADPQRAARRARLVDALAAGDHPMAAPGDGARPSPGLRVDFAAEVRAACRDDPSGDALDAVLCLVQAAWGALRRDARFGLPPDVDPVEGWILGA